MNSVSLFAPAASAEFGSQIAAALGIAMSPLEEREYDGGEHEIRPLGSVRHRSVYVIQSLRGDAANSANDRLCRLLFFIGALKDAGARKVTACVPYLAYARIDRRTRASDPVTTRYIAQIMEAVGTDGIVALDVHDVAAFENSFRMPTVHLVAASLFAREVAASAGDADYVVVSPDVGGVKRARHFRELLETASNRPVGFGFMDKNRGDQGLTGAGFMGDVAGKRVILFDDLISSGSTLLRAVEACRGAGATRVDAAVTHAAFCPQARRLFAAGGPDSVVVTDSVAMDPGFAAFGGGSLRVIGTAPLFAEAIRRIEQGVSLAELEGM